MQTPTPLADYTADHKFLVETVSKAAGIADPVAFDASYYSYYLLRKGIRGELLPIDGALIRQWVVRSRTHSPGTHFGARLYTASGIRFVHVVATVNTLFPGEAYSFFIVARSEYTKLFRLALQEQRAREVSALPPVMSATQLDTLTRNTLGYLDRKNLKRIKDLGGRAKRGLLLTGPPGNGKTSACRWLWQECLKHGYEYRMVSPDAYRAARGNCNPVQAVKELFSVSKAGVIFFDDMDIALRDRATVKETDDQAVFLSALDGIEVNEGVVYVFTTNCGLDLIDPAFKRPGRIDLVLHFQAPEPVLRRELMERWHADIQAGLNFDIAVEETAGFSFAEIEELKNLLILRYLETDSWEWDWATRQFRQNRSELASDGGDRRVGFAALAASVNGN